MGLGGGRVIPEIFKNYYLRKSCFRWMNDGGIPPPTFLKTWILVLMFIGIGRGGWGWLLPLVFSVRECTHTYTHTQIPLSPISRDEEWLCEEWLSKYSTLHIHTIHRERERESERDSQAGREEREREIG